MALSIDKNPLQWVLPHVLKLKPYSSARDEFSGQAEVYLDANENAYGSVGLGGGAVQWHRYPDPHASEFRQVVGKMVGLEAAQVFVGNGSDEAIDLLMRTFCAPSLHKIIVMPPTYGMYQVSAGINNLAVLNVPLKSDFQIDMPALATVMASEPLARLLFACSPNNPTGNLMLAADIVHVCDTFDGIVVVDEAYIDFTDRQDATKLFAHHPNLVVIRTLSKAWGLAALRIGLAFASADLVAILQKVKPPYNLSGPAHALALEALTTGQEAKNGVVRQLNQQHRWLREQLVLLPIVAEVYPSDANFVLVRFGIEVKATQVYQYLLDKGIVVRDRSSQPGCANCLRITIGTEAENQKLIVALLSYQV